MPVTVVVGGQFGSEGKGKVAYEIARRTKAAAAVRVGGPNSGHTVVGPDGNKVIFRQLPTAALLPNVICVLPAGSYIDKEVLFRELRMTGLDSSRLLIDPNAVVVSDLERGEEQARLLGQKIGSTLTGTGAAVSRRVNRLGDICLAQHDPQLDSFVQPAVPAMRSILERRKRIIIEGTQGFGLSVLHSPYYPYTTSRDTTAASFVSEAGLSPVDVDDIVLVIRAFPIRVGGNSGPLPKEISWSILTEESGSKVDLTEFTSVTKRERRVARFDPEVVRQAIACNNPTTIVLNHVDYVDASCGTGMVLTKRAAKFIKDVEQAIGSRVTQVGIGPDSLIDRRVFEELVRR
ncbi:MAG: hypothetical protein D4R74_00310 [Betaproteobacteria bacterium]|nr:MAG: hypothetical protein D4R74_00310 [Betaproteobacteria bacterium]